MGEVKGTEYFGQALTSIGGGGTWILLGLEKPPNSKSDPVIVLSQLSGFEPSGGLLT